MQEIKQLIVVDFDGKKIRPHCSINVPLEIFLNLRKNLQNSVVASAAFRFGDVHSTLGRCQGLHLNGNPNQIKSPPQESSSLLW